MSKITQIQTELRQINPAKFQQLCDSYLYRQGYKYINSTGLLIGAEKVAKGTPDSLIALPNGNYIFAEYTTALQETLARKFKSDLAKCFNEAKTGVPLVKIEEIVLCHTSILSAREEYELTEYCQQHGCKLTMYGISPMSQDLYQKFPGLAKDFLGVEVDTGQIIEPSDFVAIYNKSALATPLDTTFQFRADEVSNLLAHLAEQNLVIIVGRAGVGKSRLALECCVRFVEQRPEYTAWCILNRGVHLYDDLKVYFSPAGHYLIFVDDANRVSGFEFILQLLHEQRNDRTIKVIATVRDYALGKIRDSVRPYGGGWEIEVQPFSNEQIGEMVSTLFNIQNPLYLERITAISSGNPRLAIMASQIAARENQLNSIRDVSALYDEYYRSIHADLTGLHDHNVMKVVGIVAFFRHVDRSNDVLMQAIEAAFDISSDTFWEAVHHLHNLELVDLYENEVVRASDQVLSTYLFYVVFFKEQLISIETLLQHFFPKFTFRFIDAFNPVISVFSGPLLLDVLRPQVTRFREKFKSTHGIEDVLELVRLFWYLDETGNLLYIRECIASIEPQPVVWSEALFAPDAHATELPIPRTLGLFRYASLPSVHIALELLFNYVEKRRAELPSILHNLFIDFGFTHRSYFTGYVVEYELVKVLKSRLDCNDTDLYTYIFFVVADRFLKVHFHTTESQGRDAVTVYDFQLISTPELTALRADILRCLFALYEVPTLRSEVIAVLHSYTLYNRETGEGNVISEDSTYILTFITKKLESNEYTHCLFIQDYLDLLERRDIEFDSSIRNRFFHGNMVLKGLLFNDIRDQVKMGFDEYYVYKQQQITTYFADFDLSQYQRFFSQCEVIAQARYPQRHEGAISQGIVEILRNLSTTNATLFGEVVAYALDQGNRFTLEPWMLVGQLVNACGVERAYAILSKPQYQRKNTWLFHFFFALPYDLITSERLTQLIALYEEADPQDIPSNFDYLIAYDALEPGVLIRIVTILVEKAGQDDRYGGVLGGLFETYNRKHTKVYEFFADHRELLRRAYFAAVLVHPYADYDGSFLNIILDLDPDFSRAYVEWMYRNELWMIHQHDQRDYSRIWGRHDYAKVMNTVVQTVLREQHRRFMLESPLLPFFTKREGRGVQDISARQVSFLRNLIMEQNTDVDVMISTFNVISHFAPETRKELIEIFVKHNQRLDDFRHLPLEPNSWSWYGSRVPQLERRVEFWISLLPIFNTLDLLGHRQYIEKCILRLRKEIEYEKKKDFMED